MNSWQRVVRSGLTLVVVGALAGCAAGPSPDAVVLPTDRPLPPTDISGPWADEFVEAMRKASDPERAVLADGVVTEAERDRARQRMSRCMRDLGWRFTEHDDGTSEADPIAGRARGSVEEANLQMAACAARWNRRISVLYDAVRRNPENRDEAVIGVACLRRAGLVDRGYDTERWRRDQVHDTFPFNEWSAAASRCRDDPLGLLGARR